MTDDLAAFLRARLDEDEQVARAATAGPWQRRVGQVHIAGGQDARVIIARNAQSWNEEHIVRWHPTRALAEIDAKRRILAAFEYWQDLADQSGIASLSNFMQGERIGLWKAARCLALPYADHPDYRTEWAPCP